MPPAPSPLRPGADRLPLAALFGLWRRLILRQWALAPRGTAVLVAILAVGVALPLALRLASRAAVAGFEQFTSSVTGPADLVLRAPSGLLAESLLPTVRQVLGAEAVMLFPVIEAVAELPPTTAGPPLPAPRVLGLDLVAMRNLAEAAITGRQMDADSAAWRAAWRNPEAIAVSHDLATARGWQVGTRGTWSIGPGETAFEVVLILPAAAGERPASGHFALLDLPNLQSAMALQGWVDRLELRLEDGPELAARRHRVQALLESRAEGRWLVETPASRRATAEMMTSAFRLNLTALSLLALLVGIYLVMQALEGAVARRRPEIAVLRGLGVEPANIRLWWLAEAGALGLLGSLLGLPLGAMAAHLTAKPLASAVNNLYFATQGAAARLTWTDGALALGLGLGASLLAGWLPAADAARTPPAQLLRPGERSAHAGRLCSRRWAGVALLAGLALIWLPPVPWDGGRLPVAGWLAGGLWIMGSATLASHLLRPLGSWLTRPGLHLGPVGRYAASQLRAAGGRHAWCVAGLMLAIGMALAMAILINSFAGTVRVWVDSILRADFYVVAQGVQGPQMGDRLPTTLEAELAQDPRVAGVDVVQLTQVDLGGLPVALVGSALADGERAREMVWVRPPATPRVRTLALLADEAVISESLAERRRLRLGDALSVPTPAGPWDLRIAGVFADYGNERGVIMTSREAFATRFGTRQPTSLAVYLTPVADAEVWRAEWARRHPGLFWRNNAELRGEIWRIFGETFATTRALLGLALVAALAGLALSLTGLLVERREELRVLWELGMGRGEIARATALEGLGVVLVSLVFGSLLSLALGYLLIKVINKQSFGWTLATEIPWATYLWLGLAILALGALVSAAVGFWTGQADLAPEE